MTRDEIIALVVAKAHEHGVEPWELLGGVIAESGLAPDAARYGVWPDVSFGLLQQTVRYAAEGDQSNSTENVALIRRLYSDPSHALDIGAAAYKHWRYDPEVSALQAWCAYNLPASYRLWPDVPNVAQRENYRRGLDQARRLLGVDAVPELIYNPDQPAELQRQDWTCSVRTAMWVLKSLGIAITPGEAQDDMVAHGEVSPSVGLTDARGYGLAAMLSRHLPAEWRDRVQVFPSISFDELCSLAGSGPIALGGRAWNHWSAVRRANADGTLALANPAPNWRGVGDTLDRSEWDRLGPFSAVWVNAQAVAPIPVPADPRDARIADLEAALSAEREKSSSLVTALAVVCDDHGDTIQSQVDQMRAIREQFIGKRPA